VSRRNWLLCADDSPKAWRVVFSTTVQSATVNFTSWPLAQPLVISSGAITELTEATVSVTATVAGKTATGQGSIFLSDIWAWPDPSKTHSERDATLRSLCKLLASDLPQYCGGEPAHPLELGLRLHERFCQLDSPPKLARAMVTSPFDAALHDAVGRALERSAFSFYTEPADLPTAEPYTDGPAWQAIRDTLRTPVRQLRAWLLVSGNDGPEQLAPWLQGRGYRCLKIKLSGRDASVDAERTSEVFKMGSQLIAPDVLEAVSVDTNEGNPDAESVMAYLDELESRDPAAFAAISYLEQPTHRDITKAAYDWRPVASRCPVLLDEGLTDLDLMPLAQQQGWSGFALKTCKGHSVCLLAATWARQHGLSVSLQDLTNPGRALIHAGLLAAHLPTLNGVELNSPQYTPAANADWQGRLPDLFTPQDGFHLLPATIPNGLGGDL
jgi:L-alanine-DL-glutamate epimerase-like enolase superfamily enzyme